MNKPMQKQAGFTLIELMIVVAIVAILAAVALPAYQDYTKRAKYTELVNATTGVKTQVELCLLDLGSFATCNNNTTGPGYKIFAAADYATDVVATLTVASGAITAVPNAVNGLVAGDTYTLTPSTNTAGAVTWDVTCANSSLC